MINNFSNATAKVDIFNETTSTFFYFLLKIEAFTTFTSSFLYFFRNSTRFLSTRVVPLRSCLNNKFMQEQFRVDLQLVFAILNGKVSTAINRKLSRNFRQEGVDITPEQWTILLSLWEKDGITQQELCNATFKDKPSMTRLIDNMEKQHLVVRINDKNDRRTNLIHLTKTGRELENKAFKIANTTLEQALEGLTTEELKIGQEVLRKVFLNTKD